MKLDDLFSKISSFDYAISKQSFQCVNFDLRIAYDIVRKRVVQSDYPIAKDKLCSFSQNLVVVEEVDCIFTHVGVDIDLVDKEIPSTIDLVDARHLLENRFDLFNLEYWGG